MALIGTHISIAGGLDRAFERADILECEAIQIFTRNQRQWQVKPVSMQEAENFYRAWTKSGVRAVVAHASYLINIASGDASIRTKSRNALYAEVERCQHLNITDVVLHPGFSIACSEDEAVSNIAEELARLFNDTPECKTRVLLETMAGQGSGIGGDLAQFSEIGDKLGWHSRLGFCVDTCHIFAAGYDIRTPEAYERLVSAIDFHVGLENVYCWHLNDSKASKGSHLDRHAHIGEGEIGVLPFALLMNDRRFKNVPTILETPKEGVGDPGNLALLRKLRGL